MSRPVLSLLLVLFAASGAAADTPRLRSSSDCDIAALVGGEPITITELDLSGPAQISLVKDDLYRARMASLEGAIARRLVELEAKASNMSPSTYFDSQTRDLIAPVTQADVDAFWVLNPSLAQQGTKTSLHERIVQHLERQRSAGLEAALMARLRAKHAAAIEVRLESPRRDVPVAGAPSRGPADAPVTIVLFADFECGACAVTSHAVDETAAAYPGSVRVVHRDYPNDTHEHAVAAAAAGRCAARFGRFWELHDRLFEGTEPQVTDEQLEAAAADIGLDPEAFATCYRSDEVRAEVLADRTRAQEIGVTGTPHLFVNGLPLPGAVDARLLRDLVGTEITLAQRAAGAR